MGYSLFRMAATTTKSDARVAAVITQVMTENGISQNELHRRTGLPLMNINRRLRGQVSWTIADLEVIGRALNLTPSQITARAEEG
jgi:transcriptional regulator with XRE-family HTH domain